MSAGLIEIEDARQLVLAETKPLGTEPVVLREALGRVLAEVVYAPEAVPGSDNSAMDGYAVRSADLRGAIPAAPVVLRIVDESQAGSPAGSTLHTGEAIAISTGGVIPDGADTVVRVEDTSKRDHEVEIGAEAAEGENIRRAGEDIREGQMVLGSGTVIGPAELGLIASAARPEVACFARPRVSVVLTGDELIGPGDPSRPGAVRDSNAYTVPALAEAAGAEVFSIEHVGDDADATREALARALESDVAVVCGGVSVGVHDHVRPSLADLGVEQRFWGVALRPGKPTYFGVHPDGGLAFGLPGNPVSAMVCFTLFARHALLGMQGLDPSPRNTSAILAADYAKPPGRAHAIRCTLELTPRGLMAHPTGEQGSHILTSMLDADALAMIPTDSAGVSEGDRVDVELLPRSTLSA